MPELPDVEGFRRYFNRFAAGRRVERVEMLDRALLRNATPRRLGRSLGGRRLEPSERRGKWLLAPAQGPVLLFHFGMTGLLAWSTGQGARHRHDRLVLQLDGGDLAYRNMRRFGGVWLAASADAAGELLRPLGPDAQGIGQEQLAAIVTRRRRGLKALLMDQRQLAGVGNLLSDEVLWRARIHPERSTTSLSERELQALHEALAGTIRAANRHGRIPAEPGWLTAVRDRGGECPRCGARLERATVAGRTACWCPRCQRRRGRSRRP